MAGRDGGHSAPRPHRVTSFSAEVAMRIVLFGLWSGLLVSLVWFYFGAPLIEQLGKALLAR